MPALSPSAIEVSAATSRPDDLASGTVFVIQEADGQKRRVSMSGRCLPFRPVATSTKQRYKRTLYPGATEATVQIQGPDPQDMSVRGSFATRYMDEDLFVVEYGKTNKREVVRTATRARDVLMSLCKEGQLLTVSWTEPSLAASQGGDSGYGVTSTGILRSVKCPQNTPQDIEWEAEFDWVSDSILKGNPKVDPPPVKPTSIADAYEDLLGAIREAVKVGSAAFRQYGLGMLNRIAAIEGDVDSLRESAFDLASTPAQLAQGAAVIAGNAAMMLSDSREEAQSMMAQYDGANAAWSEAPANAVAALPWVSNRVQDCDDADVQILAAVDSVTLDLAARRVRQEAARVTARAVSLATPTRRALHLVADGDTFRRLSLRYYGTADRWMDIAEANDLVSDVELVVGMSLVIPEVA